MDSFLRTRRRINLFFQKEEFLNEEDSRIRSDYRSGSWRS